MAPPKGLAQSEFMVYVKFGALECVSIVSALSELRIVHCLFFWIPYSPRRFMLKFIIFVNRLTNRFDWFIRAIRIQHCFFG